MICKGCAKTSALNRKLFNDGGAAWYNHPANCNCECQHRKPTAWVKYFSVKEPGEEGSTINE